MRVLAIDPGSTESAYVVIDDNRRPLSFDKVANYDLLDCLSEGDFGDVSVADLDAVAIEMVASYGMPVGAEVFDTCLWIGRYTQALHAYDVNAELIKRQPVKLHHCHSPKANDATVKRALIDRFAYGQPNYGKGAKANPGWFYGFRADIWQAYALAVYAADQLEVTAQQPQF